jgi:histidinol-phosphate aminotransferase
MYPVIARVTMTPLQEVDLEGDFTWSAVVADAVAECDGDLVVFANPNNPTGVPVPLDIIVRVHDAVRGLVVVDEAYVEFGGQSAVGLLDRLPRLVVVRTFSKAFRLAGLRLGYLYGQDWVVDDLRRVRLPYHLDAVKQVASLVALEQEDAFLEHRERVAAERGRIEAALEGLPGVEVWPSVANFLLFRVVDADRVFSALLDRGVLVRDFSTKPRLEGCLRVTVGTAEENDRFVQALSEVLGESGG